eukprot:IDg5252t1
MAPFRFIFRFGAFAHSLVSRCTASFLALLQAMQEEPCNLKAIISLWALGKRGTVALYKKDDKILAFAIEIIRWSILYNE